MNRNLVFGTAILFFAVHPTFLHASEVDPSLINNVANIPPPQENVERLQQYREIVGIKILRNLVVPLGTPDSLITGVQIRILPDGVILAIYITKSSGYQEYDAAVLKAIQMSSPLPATKGWFMWGKPQTIQLDIRN